MDVKSSNEAHETLVNEWFIFKDCNKFGPLTAKEIGDLLDNNQISKDHHVWHQKYNNWIAIKDVDQFNSVGFELQLQKKNADFIEDAPKAAVKKVTNVSAIKTGSEDISIMKKIFNYFFK